MIPTFFSHKKIKGFFHTVNSELEKTSQWFKDNKLSINIKETKFTLFHKSSSKDDMPVKLPALLAGSNNVKRTSSIKFLGIMLDEYISWIDHIRIVENKIAKNIGLPYLVSHFLNEYSLKTVYCWFIHSYLNYANIAWGITYATKLKRVCLKQKHALCIVFNKDKLTH